MSKNVNIHKRQLNSNSMRAQKLLAGLHRLLYVQLWVDIQMKKLRGAFENILQNAPKSKIYL